MPTVNSPVVTTVISTVFKPTGPTLFLILPDISGIYIGDLLMTVQIELLLTLTEVTLSLGASAHVPVLYFK